MPKLYKYTQLINAFKRLGFSLISQQGSHIKIRGIVDGQLRTAIVPAHREIALGTLSSILKQANISKHELEANVR